MTAASVVDLEARVQCTARALPLNAQLFRLGPMSDRDSQEPVTSLPLFQGW